MPELVSLLVEKIVYCFFLPFTLTDTCVPPERLQYAELDEGFNTMMSFPVGTTVSYVCRPGYMRILGKSLTRTCGEDLQWSPVEQFCTGNESLSSFAFSCWCLTIWVVFQVRISMLQYFKQSLESADNDCKSNISPRLSLCIQLQRFRLFFFSFLLPLERKCTHPGDLEHGTVHVTDLTFGSKATFSCNEG